MLRLEKISIGYQDNILLSDLDVEFTVGKINLILGASGTGKSTLLKAIAGFHKVTNGNMTLNDKPFLPSGKIALAFQNPETLFFNGTVGEEVSYALTQLSIPEREVISRSKSWLNTWGLEPDTFWHRHPMSLSGGEQRRVALAACTVFTPPVIMLDEPLAGLDNTGQIHINSIISELAKNSIVIVVTHDPNFMLEYSSNIIVLRKNKGLFYNSVNAFVKSAILDSSLYMLPEWYVEAVGSNIGNRELPQINAKSVYEFIKSSG